MTTRSVRLVAIFSEHKEWWYEYNVTWSLKGQIADDNSYEFLPQIRNSTTLFTSPEYLSARFARQSFFRQPRFFLLFPTMRCLVPGYIWKVLTVIAKTYSIEFTNEIIPLLWCLTIFCFLNERVQRNAFKFLCRRMFALVEKNIFWRHQCWRFKLTKFSQNRNLFL